jgi:hypothetical protein
MGDLLAEREKPSEKIITPLGILLVGVGSSRISRKTICRKIHRMEKGHIHRELQR